MVLPRGSESWRRMSRFRRQSLVKPLAAEVLEPRCLMTEATGTLAAADAAPLTGAVVVDASLWDDAGLTLQQIGDLLHVFRTDTQTDVITPLLASEITSLNFIGRDNAADVLTLELSYDWTLPYGTLLFNGGIGVERDLLRLLIDPDQSPWNGGSVAYFPGMNSSGSISGRFEEFDEDEITTGAFHFTCDYYGVECVEDGLSTNRDHTNLNNWDGLHVAFWLEQNDIAVVLGDDAQFREIHDRVTETTIRFAKGSFWVWPNVSSGGGDDRIQIEDEPGSRSRESEWNWSGAVFDGDFGDDVLTSSSIFGNNIRGGAGNDTLLSGPAADRLDGDEGDDVIRGQGGNDRLDGGEGDDVLDGGDGDDQLDGGEGDNLLGGGAGDDQIEVSEGNNSIDGGSGTDTVSASEHSEKGHRSVIVGTVTMTGFGNNRRKNIESIYLLVGNKSRVDASSASENLMVETFWGKCTLIGGSGDDSFEVAGGHNLVIGGGGSDWLSGEDPATDTLKGGAGIDTINGVADTDQIQIDHRSSDAQSDTSLSKSADDTSVIPNHGGDFFDSPSFGDVLLIGQGIATVGIEDRELAEFDTASSDSAFGELADSEPEDGDALAANGVANSADKGEGLELDAALSDALLASLTEPLPTDANL